MDTKLDLNYLILLKFKRAKYGVVSMLAYNDPAANRSDMTNTENMENENKVAVEPHISCCYIFHPTECEWGGSIYIMQRDGCAFVRLYFYNDDFNTIYIEGLSVDQKERGKGRGTELLKVAEKEAKKINGTMICLWVNKYSWVHNWYQCQGYVDSKDHDCEPNSIWMMKSI